MKPLILNVILVSVFSASVFLTACAGNAVERLDNAAADPLNAADLIEGQAVRLVDGRSEKLAAPESATQTRSAVLGRPVFGDLDGAAGEDAVLLLRHDPGGSGTFYYLAAAVSVDGRYRGTNAVLLGDRIVPRDLKIRRRLAVVRYTDRRPDEPMSARPTITQLMALAMEDGHLQQTGPPVEGQVIIGHEVRAFRPCSESESLWLMGRSPALKEIMAAYQRMRPDEKPYRPVFAVLSGDRTAPPIDGFGADYQSAFWATHLLWMVPEERCPRDDGHITSALPLEEKIAFDISTLDEVGLYGPPEAKRALSYAFCIPAGPPHRAEVERIDQTAAFLAVSPGRIGCGTHEILCIGSTHQKDFRRVLRRLAELPYVQRIEQSFFE